jgi:hypothetical protein
MNVTACVFELAGLPISLVYQGTDDVPRGCYLSEIAGILSAEISPLKRYSPISVSSKQDMKSLSSNQLFLGVFQSPQRDSLIEAKPEVSKHLQLSSAFSLENTERKLKQVFNRRLNVADLRHIGDIIRRTRMLGPDHANENKSLNDVLF